MFHPVYLKQGGLYGNPNMTKLSNSNIASAKVQRSNYPKYQECKRSTRLSNSNIASAKVQRSNYPKYQECKRSTKQLYCKYKSPNVKLPKISRVQKINKKLSASRKPNITGALDLCRFFTCNIWFSTFCTLDILGSLTFGLLHLQYCSLIVL